MPPRRSSQPGNDDGIVEIPAERSVAEYDSTDAIEIALCQFTMDGETDWALKNYDAETTVDNPNKIEDEASRLAVLKSYGILDSKKEEEFDAITNECKEYFNCPIAVVTLVDMGRQWFKSIQGLPAESTPRCLSFCAHVVKKKSESVMVVPDATQDVRFKDNPMVSGGPMVRFYAGAPLITPEGAKVGALCIIDFKPHPEGLSTAQQERLMTLAQEVVLNMVMRA